MKESDLIYIYRSTAKLEKVKIEDVNTGLHLVDSNVLLYLSLIDANGNAIYVKGGNLVAYLNVFSGSRIIQEGGRITLYTPNKVVHMYKGIEVKGCLGNYYEGIEVKPSEQPGVGKPVDLRKYGRSNIIACYPFLTHPEDYNIVAYTSEPCKCTILPS